MRTGRYDDLHAGTLLAFVVAAGFSAGRCAAAEADRIGRPRPGPARTAIGGQRREPGPYVSPIPGRIDGPRPYLPD
jgi:hypothetical protein